MFYHSKFSHILYVHDMCYHTRSGLDDLSDEELSNEENHQGSDNDATCTNLTSSADKVETNSSETDANKSSENSPAVAVENTEDNNVNDDSKITESTSPSSECSRDEKETKEAVITESNASVSEDKPTTENTAPTLDAFEVSYSQLIILFVTKVVYHSTAN